MWELDHKKAECWTLRTWYLQTVVLKKTLENPLDIKEIKPTILREINPEYSLEGLMLKLKHQYFDHMIQRAGSLGKTLMLGKIESRRGQQMMKWLSGITNSVDMNMSKFQEITNDREAWPVAAHGVTKIWKQLGTWTTTNAYCCQFVCLFVFCPAYSFYVFLFLSLVWLCTLPKVYHIYIILSLIDNFISFEH